MSLIVAVGGIVPFQHGVRLEQIQMIADAIPYHLRAIGVAQTARDARDPREDHEDIQRIQESHPVERTTHDEKGRARHVEKLVPGIVSLPRVLDGGAVFIVAGVPLPPRSVVILVQHLAGQAESYARDSEPGVVCECQ